MKIQTTVLFFLSLTTFLNAQIPGANFETWQTITFEYPQHADWTIYHETTSPDVVGLLEKSGDASYGDYAIKFNTYGTYDFGYVVYGQAGNEGPTGGIPFADDPTQVTISYKCNMAAGDSAGVWVFLYSNGSQITNDKFWVGGIQSVYKDTTFNLSAYTATPDSLMFAVVPCDPFVEDIRTDGNEVYFDSVRFNGINNVQIPDNSFEVWTGKTQDYMAEIHYIRALCEKSDDAYNGNFALKMSTQNVMWDNNNYKIDMDNELTLWGKRDWVEVSPDNHEPRITGGLPIHARKDTFVFYYKYVPPAGVIDTAELNLIFDKDSLAVYNNRHFLKATDTYTKFEIPYDLDNAGGGSVEADSMVLTLASSKWRNNWLEADTAIEGSSLFIDYMYFKSQLFQTDSLALVALYDSTDGANWTNNTNWLTGPVSTWYGITVSGDRVTQIYINSNNLVGTIPPEIGNLTNLNTLELRSNQLSGSIPTEIGNLTNLGNMQLSDNDLSGSIPPEIGELTYLEILSLSSNQLSGTLPAEIGNLANLQRTDICDNNITGPIPDEIGNLSNLQMLRLYGNQLSDTIPSTIGNLSNLNHLDIRYNLLTGPVPVEIGNLLQLTELIMPGNQLSGAVPNSITNLSYLEQLNISNNKLTDLPNLSTLDSLNDLSIQNNKFTFGDIEPNIGVPDSTFTYSPQDSVGQTIDTTVYAEANLTLSVSTGGANSLYQWKKDGNNIGSNSSDSTYTIISFTSSDEGAYTCEITNTFATELTLYSRPINVTITDGPTISGFPYSENFEDGDGGWCTGGTNSSWEHGIPSAAQTINSAASGSNVWVTNLTGDYNPDEVSYVMSPQFDLSSLNFPKIGFSIWWYSEGFYDGANLQYKLGSDEWKTLGKEESDDSWYNSSYLYSIENGFGFDMDKSAGWSGDDEWGYGSSGWVTVDHALTGFDYQSANVTFRIGFASNDGYENDGVAIDDINIYDDPTGIDPVRGLLSDIQIYPNPNEGKFRLVYRGERDIDLDLQLINIQGQVILSQKVQTGKRFSKEFELNYLPPGIYYFRLMNKESIVVKKMVVR